jgi:hypothetical protein
MTNQVQLEVLHKFNDDKDKVERMKPIISA